MKFIYLFLCLINTMLNTMLILERKEKFHTQMSKLFPTERTLPSHMTHHIDTVLHTYKCFLIPLSWCLWTGFKVSFNLYHLILFFTLGEFTTSLLQNLFPPLMFQFKQPTTSLPSVSFCCNAFYSINTQDKYHFFHKIFPEALIWK